MIDLTKEKGKNIGIFGLARTGIATYTSLYNIANLVCWDDSEKNRQNFVESCGAELCNIHDRKWTKLDYIVLSPGVPLYFPKPHQVVEIANKHSIPLISDIELLYRARPNATYIGITGTNGKSTTTALIGHILGDSFSIGGNIGLAALSIDDDAEGYALELSSYQLDLLYNFRPKVAVLLNITPDHLDRHGSLEGYIKAKSRIWQNMGAGDTLVIGVDNDITNRIYRQLLADSAPFKLIPISANNDSTPLPKNNFLQGLHNRENTIAAYAAVKALGYSDDYIFNKIQSFVGLKHRMQFLGRHKNASFYNDSKATNAEAASKSLGALDNIYWLAGGIQKEGGIESLKHLFPKIKKAYLYGDAKEEFAKTLKDTVDFVICDSMQEALKLALSDALADTAQANILLAPACASFDQFKDFEERGDKFIELVKLVV